MNSIKHIKCDAINSNCKVEAMDGDGQESRVNYIGVDVSPNTMGCLITGSDVDRKMTCVPQHMIEIGEPPVTHKASNIAKRYIGYGWK